MKKREKAAAKLLQKQTMEAAQRTEAMETTEAATQATNTKLRLMFVGNQLMGKTTLISKFRKGGKKTRLDERTINVEISSWKVEGAEMESMSTGKMGDGKIRFTVWDFAGQTERYHATHELYFNRGSMYIVVWDMGALCKKTYFSVDRTVEGGVVTDSGGIEDCGDDSDDSDESEHFNSFAEGDQVTTNPGLEHQISDEAHANEELDILIEDNVQRWIDTIQASAPGAVILPVLTFADAIYDHYKELVGPNSDSDRRLSKLSDEEVERRVNRLREKLERNEENRVAILTEELELLSKEGRDGTKRAMRLKQALGSRPRIQFDDISVCGQEILSWDSSLSSKFNKLKNHIVSLATRGHSRDSPDSGHPMATPKLFPDLFASIPLAIDIVGQLVRDIRNKEKVSPPRMPIVSFSEMLDLARQRDERFGDERFGNNEEGILNLSDALVNLNDNGSILYFGEDVLLPSSSVAVYEEEQNVLLRNTSSSVSRTSSTDSLSSTCFSISHTSGRITELCQNAPEEKFVIIEPNWLMLVIRTLLDHKNFKKNIEELRKKPGGRKKEQRDLVIFDEEIDALWNSDPM